MAGGIAELIHEGIRVQGFSLAGEETYIILPEMNVAFDVGRAPREIIPIEHLFLTHGHIDHTAGLAFYAAQRWFLDAAAGNIYVSASLVEPIQRMLRSWADIDGREPPAHVVAVTPGTDVPVRRDLVVRPFEVNHFGPRTQRGALGQALGYSVIEVRNKLHEEYVGLSGPQIVELKKQGVEITRRVEIPLVAYCGDTGPGDFFELPWVSAARVLIMECTFFGDDDLRRARAGGHTHVSDLPGILARLKNEKIVIVHTSRRLILPEARAILHAQLGAAAERVTFLMEHRRRGPRRASAQPQHQQQPRQPAHEPQPPPSTES